MRDAIALTADIVTIVGVLTLLAFLLNHPVAKILGVRAGALLDPYGYGWKRRRRFWHRWRHAVSGPLLRTLSRLGSERRQPMEPAERPLAVPEWLADEMRPRHEGQREGRQLLMVRAAVSTDIGRWRRDHRRVRCEKCKRPFRDLLMWCLEDCSWGEQHPKNLRHRCFRCLLKLNPATDGRPTHVTAGPRSLHPNAESESHPAGDADTVPVNPESDWLRDP